MNKMSENEKNSKKKKGISISKDLRRMLHNALCNYAKLYMKELGYNFYELKTAIPDLIATDHFGNIIVIEALTHPTPQLIKDKITRYRRQKPKQILFVVPYLTDEIMHIIMGKPDVDVIDMGLEEGEEPVEE